MSRDAKEWVIKPTPFFRLELSEGCMRDSSEICKYKLKRILGEIEGLIFAESLDFIFEF